MAFMEMKTIWILKNHKNATKENSLHLPKTLKNNF